MIGSLMPNGGPVGPGGGYATAIFEFGGSSVPCGKTLSHLDKKAKREKGRECEIGALRCPINDLDPETWGAMHRKRAAAAGPTCENWTRMAEKEKNASEFRR